MSIHDPLCVSQEFLPADLTRFCDCERVARIRADERAKAHVHATGTSTGDGPCCECCYDVNAALAEVAALRELIPVVYGMGRDDEAAALPMRQFDMSALIEEVEQA